ncbi:peptidylprolyl isomerase [Clostridium fallax]|uniref:Foldase protein PrsA n=1 Tax=Clostridium fallax TaxID=1533 RepID=A0A1M4TDW6_9CLOT|nr:peptidylprolyl isomerase [Clostridium fallax]SHE42643.1 foldase protein PrsA [Clostridium fallax]SQB22718.1 peptidyl-prolyl isomerase [Clostridium fallax]
MKKVKGLIGAAMVAVFAFSLAGCKMIQKTPEAIKNTVVAKLDGQKITLGEVDDKMPGVISQIKQKYGDNYASNEEAVKALANQRKTTLDNMVMEDVLVKEAEKLKLVPSDEELNKEVDQKIEDLKKIYGTEEAYNKAVESAGYNNDTLKDFLKKQIIAQKAMDYAVKDVDVTDEDVQKYYDTNKDSQFTEKPGANLSHILVKTEDEAKDIKNQLDNGADFASLAKKYGTDGTKDNGGSLGFVEYDSQNYDKDFLAAAKNLSEGQISEPVKTQFGWHIIKATNIRKDAKVTPFDDVKSKIKEFLTNQKKSETFKKTYDEWKKELGVQVYDDKLNEVY